MTDEGNAARAWEDDIVYGLKCLTADEIPSLEILLLDAVAAWLVSPDNPGEGYTEEHAGHLVSTLFSAVDSARGFQPSQRPAVSEEMVISRTRIVDGAHELAKEGPPGVSLMISRLMPAVLAELQNNTGERSKQARGLFVYLVYGIALGTRVEQYPAVMDGLLATFAAWDALLRSGYVVPWRRPPGESRISD